MKKIIFIFIATAILFSSCGGSEEAGDTKNAKTLVQEKAVLVNIRQVSTHQVAHTFTATGKAIAEKSAFISSEMNGQIKKVYVSEGQFVQRGTLLISLNSAVIRSGIGEVKSALELATILYKKQDLLWNTQKVGKEIDFLKAKNQKESLEAKLKTLNAQLAMSQVRAPFAGIVDEIYGQAGELASPGRMLIQFVNLSQMKIEADVSENYLPYIKKGAEVSLSFPSLPEKKIKTRITRTGNVINPANRTFKVELKMANPGREIKPNMVANIQLTDYQNKHITVPAIVVKSDRTGEYVYIVEDSKAKKVYVKTGFPIDTEVIIIEGLKEGDKVITQGYNLVSQGAKIKL